MELKQVYETRRSVNFFDKTKQLDETILKKIIDLAVLAPSAYNLQPWEIIAAKSDEAKQKLFMVSNKQPKILDAPVTLIIIGDRNGTDASNPVWNELLQMTGDPSRVTAAQEGALAVYGTTEESKIKFAESNGGLLAMSIMYAAKEFGVDSHPMSGIDFNGAHKAFNIPEGKSIVMLISLGYYDTSRALYPRRRRRGYDEIVTVL